jgi:hypothetical protein
VGRGSGEKGYIVMYVLYFPWLRFELGAPQIPSCTKIFPRLSSPIRPVY